MASSIRSPKRKGVNRLLVSVPILALVGVLGVYFIGLQAPPAAPAAQDFTAKMIIQFTNSTHFQYVTPPLPVGVAGGYWRTHQYDSLAVDSSHYPIYMESVATTQYFTIHVKSKQIHNFTIGDFFAVWGEPISQTNSLGVKATGSKLWQLCAGTANVHVPARDWDRTVLTPGLDLILVYYDQNNGLGCA